MSHTTVAHTRQVTLLLPWLALSDQRRLFPDGLAFASPDAQEAWVRSLICKWLFIAFSNNNVQAVLLC